MHKYSNYVKNIKLSGFKNLILIPLGIGFLTYLSPNIIQLIFVAITREQVALGSFSSNMGMMLTFVLMPALMIKVSKVNYKTLGIYIEGCIKNILLGAISGFITLSIVALIILSMGAIDIEKNSFNITIAFIGGLEFFILQGIWEELIYRGYLMPFFSKKYNDKVSIIVTSALFTLGHALNPNMSILPVINLFIASIVFSLIYYYFGNLLLVGLSHGIWNFSQGYIFGAEVSGHTIPSSLFKSIPLEGKNFISGGSFGFEGGIITTIVGIILIIIFIKLIRKDK